MTILTTAGIRIESQSTAPFVGTVAKAVLETDSDSFDCPPCGAEAERAIALADAGQRVPVEIVTHTITHAGETLEYDQAIPQFVQPEQAEEQVLALAHG